MPPYPLDILGAETQGMIGYFLAQALRNELPRHEVVALLTLRPPEGEAGTRIAAEAAVRS